MSAFATMRDNRSTGNPHNQKCIAIVATAEINMYRVLLSSSVHPVMEKDLYSLMATLSWYRHSHTRSPVSKHWYRHVLQNKRTCSCNNYNFEGLKLQFPALSSPYPLCYRKTYPRPHGITVKTVPIPAMLPRYPQ